MNAARPLAGGHLESKDQTTHLKGRPCVIQHFEWVRLYCYCRVKFAVNTRTGQEVAIKVLSRSLIKERKMAQSVKKEVGRIDLYYPSSLVDIDVLRGFLFFLRHPCCVGLDRHHANVPTSKRYPHIRSTFQPEQYLHRNGTWCRGRAVRPYS